MNEIIISVGGRIIVDGNLCEIVEICGMTVTLRGPDQRLSVRTARDLVRSSPLLPEESPCIEPDPIGHLMSALTPLQRERLIQTVRDVREVLTGYPDDQPALDQLPRPEYSASKRLGERQAAKAAERGVSARAVRRWCDSYTLSGPIGLVDRRLLKGQAPLRGIDPRWISSCLEVVEAHTFASRPTQQLLLERIEKHVDDTYGADVVAIPKREKARRAVKELTRGTNALTGSTKTKRSVANRPSGPYGRLRPTRPGEYVLLDTTPLDVFAMDPVTLKWVGLELTIALDLYTRTVPGLSLTPVSTKSTDAAAVLYDTMGCPDPQHPLASFEGLQEVPGAGMPVSSLPLICAETVLIDHGKIYISDHIASVCARLGISVQPGRPYTPTDKAAVERFFRTLREELLAALPGYKGPDIHSRGHRVEDQAFYFRHELEDIIRRWIVEVYHQRPHSGLVDEQIPGVCYTPMQRLEAGIARAGFLRIPGSPNLALDFLPVEWRTVQHYGVEIDGLRYNGSALDYVRNATSPHGGTKRGKWPFRVDPNNRQQIFFYNEDSGSWHALDWNGRESIPQPFSSEVYRYATRIAASTHKIPDSRRALRELLERWEAGVVSNPIERRMWLRLSAETEQQLPDELTAVLPSDATPGNAVEDPLLVVSDDDMVEELLDDSGDDGDFYGDAYELGE